MPCELNEAFYPILLMGMDEPFAPGEIEAYLDELVVVVEKSMRLSQRHVVIVTNDPLKVSAAGRRRVAEAVSRKLTPQQVDVTLASFLPIDNTLIRGVLTAFRWFSPETIKTLRVVSTMEGAFAGALRELEANGTPFEGDRLALRRALKIGV